MAVKRVDDSCVEILRQHGVSWWFDPRVKLEGSLVRDVLGDRDEGLQSNRCFISDQSAYVKIPDSQYFNRLGTGSFTVAVFVQFPVGSDNGSRQSIVSKQGDFDLYQLNGNLYFRIEPGQAEEEEVNTEGSGTNFCDGYTRLIFAGRDSRGQTDVLFINSIEDPVSVITNISEVNLTGSGGMIVNGYSQAGTVGRKTYNGTSIFGFVLILDYVSIEQRQFYWLEGKIPVNDVLVYRLDERSGELVYDASGLGHHGVIENYDQSVRGLISEGFSWQNKLGYSTGQYAVDNGVTQMVVDGDTFLIDTDSLIPFTLAYDKFDAVGLPVEYEGRARVNLQIQDVLCYRGDGSTYGQLVGVDNMMYDIGTDFFSVFLMFNMREEEGGTLLRVGDQAEPRYSILFEPGNTDMILMVGSTVHTVDLSEGEYKVLLYFTDTQIDVWVNGNSLSPLALDQTNTAGNEGFLFSDGVADDVLQGMEVGCVGIRTGVLQQGDIDGFMGEESLLPGNFFEFLYAMPTKHDVLFDMSGKERHIILEDYSNVVWEGRQSEFVNVTRGFKRVYPSRGDRSQYVILPYDIQGRRMSYSVYGASQYEVTYEFKSGGIPMVDAYVNMNPEGKELGFYSRFWDKSNTEVWVSLNSNYLRSNTHLWHVEELQQQYFETVLSQDYYNFVFAVGRENKSGEIIEIVDVFLLNLGNDIRPRELPA